MRKYPILQSGFISVTENDLIKGDSGDPAFPDNLLLKAYKRTSNGYFYNKTVSKLFSRYLANNSAIREFDFRESIIKLAFSCFATKSIFDWIHLQSNQSTVSDLHKAFIMSTLDYVVNFQPREVEVGQWIRLLEADEKTYSTIIDVKSYYADQNKLSPIPSNMEQFIHRWLARPNGFEDLLFTLQVIFGERGQLTDVSNLY